MWHIVLTKPKQENRAKENLENQGIEVFLPLFHKETIKNGKRVNKIEPLFPGYLFIKLDKGSSLFSKVRSTFGVNKLLSFGAEPVVIERALIEDLQSRSAHLNNTPKFKAGQSIRINNGPLKHYEALFMEYKGNERAVILISLLGQQNELVIELEKLA